MSKNEILESYMNRICVKKLTVIRLQQTTLILGDFCIPDLDLGVSP